MLTASTSIGDDVRAWYADFLYLAAVVFVAPVLGFVLAVQIYESGPHPRLFVLLGIDLVATVTVVATRRLPWRVRGLVFVAYTFTLANASLAVFGPLLGTGVLFMSSAMSVGIFRSQKKAQMLVLGLACYALIASTSTLPYGRLLWFRAMMSCIVGTSILANIVARLISRLEAAHLKIVDSLAGEARERDARLEAEQRLEQSRRIEALGRLAGGIAHDVNNSLTIIVGNTHLLLESPTLNEKDREMLDDIAHASESSRETVQQLLLLARRAPGDRASCSTREVIEPLSRAVSRLLPESIRLTLDVAAHCRLPLSDNNLHRTMMNLVLNARDALPAGGEITVSLRVEGAVCVLSVTDNGIGMDAPTRARALEPFFTTKALGKGTGLGLSLADAQVRAVGGQLSLQSAPGEGTRVELRIPVEVSDTDGHGPVHRAA